MSDEGEDDGGEALEGVELGVSDVIEDGASDGVDAGSVKLLVSKADVHKRKADVCDTKHT